MGRRPLRQAGEFIAVKMSPAAVVLDPADAPDLPALGVSRRDVWTVHDVVDGQVFSRQAECYGYVYLYDDERRRKGILWVDRREYAVLCSCESTGASANGITAEDIAAVLAVSPWPRPEVVEP